MTDVVEQSRMMVRLDELRPGLLLPGPIYDGRRPTLLLLRSGTLLTPALLGILRERQISDVSIAASDWELIRQKPAGDAENDPSLAERDAICGRNWVNVLSTVREIANERRQLSTQLIAITEFLQRSSRCDMRMLDAIVESLSSRIDSELEFVIASILHVSQNSSLFDQCLRTAQLGICVARQSNFPEVDVRAIAQGLLLSRAGVIDNTQEVISKGQKLSQIELLEMQKVPARTFDFLEKMPDLSPGARQVACQIFERLDGSGYPRNRQDRQIFPLARLGAVCDVFCALTAPRPHRAALNARPALGQLANDVKKNKFDAQSVQMLTQVVGLFPIGSYVKLDNGALGVVLGSYGGCNDRPVLQVLIQPTEGEPQAVIDLQRQPNEIANVLTEPEARVEIAAGNASPQLAVAGSSRG